jgi:hypothetical protein
VLCTANDNNNNRVREDVGEVSGHYYVISYENEVGGIEGVGDVGGKEQEDEVAVYSLSSLKSLFEFN